MSARPRDRRLVTEGDAPEVKRTFVLYFGQSSVWKGPCLHVRTICHRRDHRAVGALPVAPDSSRSLSRVDDLQRAPDPAPAGHRRGRRGRAHALPMQWGLIPAGGGRTARRRWRPSTPVPRRCRKNRCFAAWPRPSAASFPRVASTSGARSTAASTLLPDLRGRRGLGLGRVLRPDPRRGERRCRAPSPSSPPVPTAGRALHDRMPVILRREDEEEWVSRDVTDPPAGGATPRPYPADEMRVYPVKHGGDQHPRNNGPELIAPDEGVRG